MTRNEFDLLYAIMKNGRKSVRELAEISHTSTGFVSEKLRAFENAGYIDADGVSDSGLEALEPYKVKNAIIMAAGMSSRFVPLSLEKPKGLLVVKNEVLIERQIEQLREAGIDEIVLVLGYKKESFFYLESKYDLKIIINPSFHIKNNLETVFLAQKYIGNSYICSSDDYFVENPFEDYVYQSYYSAIHVDEKTDEWYMHKDARGNITKVMRSGDDGDIMLGHVYWDSAFSEAFLRLVNEHHELGDYDTELWESLFSDNIAKLPPMQVKVYPDNMIYEFDSLDELRQFDRYYVKNTHSKIMKNIARVLDCGEEDITGFKAIKEGLTNTSFVFEVNGEKYVYRHPGDGTEAIISRSNEKHSLELAKSVGVDPTYIYMDEKEGWKLSRFVADIRTPDYDSFEDSRRVIDVMRRLHEQKMQVDWSFLPWDGALDIERMLREKGKIEVPDFDELKGKVEKCYNAVKDDGVEMCFCHCDTYAPNWMLTDDRTILIDWEYAGNADPGCDVSTYIMDAMWDTDTAERFVREYCGENYSDQMLFHYFAYVAIVSYYWFVWALYREACGGIMGESLHNWYVMAKRYSGYLCDKYLSREVVSADIERVSNLLFDTVGKRDFKKLTRMGGLTNRTYRADFDENEIYIVRIPGEGTEEMIVRSDEKISTSLACELDIDAKLIHFGDDGSKVTCFIPNAITMSAETFADHHRIEQAANIMRTLHGCGKDTGVKFEVFDMAENYEKIINDKNVPMFADYSEVKEAVMRIKKAVDSACEIKKVPCHNDVLCENWIVSADSDRMYLVDWEYAGMNDGIWDVADLSIEAGFDRELDIVLLKAYHGHEPTRDDMRHFLANKLYVDYLWTLWAKTRVPYDGQPMEDWALERYTRLKKNIWEYDNIK